MNINESATPIKLSQNSPVNDPTLDLQTELNGAAANNNLSQLLDQRDTSEKRAERSRTGLGGSQEKVRKVDESQEMGRKSQQPLESENYSYS